MLLLLRLLAGMFPPTDPRMAGPLVRGALSWAPPTPAATQFAEGVSAGSAGVLVDGVTETIAVAVACGFMPINATALAAGLVSSSSVVGDDETTAGAGGVALEMRGGVSLVSSSQGGSSSHRLLRMLRRSDWALATESLGLARTPWSPAGACCARAVAASGMASGRGTRDASRWAIASITRCFFWFSRMRSLRSWLMFFTSVSSWSIKDA